MHDLLSLKLNKEMQAYSKAVVSNLLYILFYESLGEGICVLLLLRAMKLFLTYGHTITEWHPEGHVIIIYIFALLSHY